MSGTPLDWSDPAAIPLSDKYTATITPLGPNLEGHIPRAFLPGAVLAGGWHVVTSFVKSHKGTPLVECMLDNEAYERTRKLMWVRYGVPSEGNAMIHADFMKSHLSGEDDARDKVAAAYETYWKLD